MSGVIASVLLQQAPHYTKRNAVKKPQEKTSAEHVKDTAKADGKAQEAVENPNEQLRNAMQE